MDERAPSDELAELVARLRERLDWQRRGGVLGMPVPRAATRAPARAATTTSTTSGAAPTARPPTTASSPSPISTPSIQPPPRSNESLAAIRADLGDCRRCKLCSTRTSIVFGVGSPTAHILFVGEGPGADEDRTGEPFVGAAGQLLTKMIGAMGYARDEVYICNVVKCRPPGNRNPEPDEIAACEPFLARQIAAVAPRVIVTLGKFAAQTLLRADAPISALRGRFHSYSIGAGAIPVMPTFHPAYLLRTPEAKKDAWADLQEVMRELDRLGVPRGVGAK